MPPAKRKWSRAAQVALERPRRPHVPDACPQCGCRWYFRDEDLDWICLMCGRTLVLWSRYRYELRGWKEGLAARAEGYKRKDEAA